MATKKTGRRVGRPKGAVSKANELARRKAAESGMLPLEYMLNIMRDPKQKKERRDDMAKAAAPYCHSKLSAVTHSGDPTKPVVMIHCDMTPAEAAQHYADMLKN